MENSDVDKKNIETASEKAIFQKTRFGDECEFKVFLLITLVTQSFKSDNQFDWLFDLINMMFDQIDSTIQLKRWDTVLDSANAIYIFKSMDCIHYVQRVCITQ